MLRKLLLLCFTFSNAGLIFFALCLGAQNLNERKSLNFLSSKTSQLPVGFLVGTSIITGVITGGTTAAVLIPIKKINSSGQ